MKKKFLVLSAFLILLPGLLLLAPSAAVCAEGYWKFSHIKLDEVESTKTAGWKRYATGVSGSVTVYNVLDAGTSGKQAFVVNGHWSNIPGALIPEREYRIHFGAKVIQHIPPSHHWSPSVTISVLHTRRSQESVDNLSTLSNQFWNIGLIQIRPSKEPGVLPEERKIAELIPPAPYSSDHNEFGVRVWVGGASTKYFTYVYKWQPGTPTQAEMESIIPDGDSLDTAVVSDPGDAIIVSVTRGRVEVQNDGSDTWSAITSGHKLRPGDMVRTDEKSSAEVVFPDRTMVRMLSDSILEISSLVPGQDASDRVRVVAGKIWVKAAERNVPFEVESYNAVAGVLGTTLSVGMNEIRSEQFNCYSGEISVDPFSREGRAGAGRKVVLESGQSVAFAPRGQMGGIGDLAGEEVSVGLIMTSPDLLKGEVSSSERNGTLVFERELDEWRLEVYENGGARHGILIFSGLPVREVGRERLASPFGTLTYHGAFSSSSNSGWLPAEAISTVDTPDPGVSKHSNKHISLAKAVFSAEDFIEVEWHGLPGGRATTGDWIAIVSPQSPDTTWGNWWYTSGRQSGTRNLGKLNPGEYEIRVYFDWPGGGYNVQSRLRFTVQ